MPRLCSLRAQITYEGMVVCLVQPRFTYKVRKRGRVNAALKGPIVFGLFVRGYFSSNTQVRHF